MLRFDGALTHTLINNLGPMTCWYSNVDTVGMQGNRLSIFTQDHLYRFYNPIAKNEFWFKFNLSSYNPGSNITSLGVGQYLGNQPINIPTPVNYEISEYSWHQQSQFDKTICTIGDSITWYAYGSYFRQCLRDAGLQYDFVGNHVDTFGYGHSAEGGDNTVQILARKQFIPLADVYHIWAGTNDVALYPNDPAPIIAGAIV